MNNELKELLDVNFVDISIRQDRADFDIEIRLLSGEYIRFFVYPEIVDFNLSWYGTTAGYADGVKINYISNIAKIANKLNNKENLLSLINILRSAQ